MNKEQIEQLEAFAFELKNNRDYYSRAKIIEMMVDEVKKLNKPAVIKRYGGIEITLEQAEAIDYVLEEVDSRLGDFGKSIKEYLACQTKLINDGMPFHKRPSLDNRAILAKELFVKGYSIRQIARKLNYKSPRSVQLLLNRAVANVL